MAPEVLGSNDHYSTSCDVYSFGLIMYQVLFESIPFSIESCNVYTLAVDILRGRRPKVPWIIDNMATKQSSDKTINSGELQQDHYIDGMMRNWCAQIKYPVDQLKLCIKLMNNCWNENASERPSFELIYGELEQIFNNLE